MQRFNAANNWQEEIKNVGGISDTDDQINVGEIDSHPIPPFKITVGDEIMNVTSVSTVEGDSTLFVERGIEGTAAVAHDEGEKIENRLTAEVQNNLWDSHEGHVGATGDAHGAVTTSVNGFMDSDDKSKLNGIDDNANNYSLETHDNAYHSPNFATASDLSNHEDEIASDTELGHIIVGDNLSIEADGTLNAAEANGMETHDNTYHSPNFATAADLTSHENEEVNDDEVHGLRESSIAIGEGSLAFTDETMALGPGAATMADRTVSLGFGAATSEVGVGMLGGDGANDTDDWRVPGDFTVSGSKDFGITNPANPDEDLRHGCVESPTPQNIYRFSVELDASETEQEIELPDWFKPLNADPQVFVNPNKHFGKGYGYVENNTLKIAGDKEGEYNVLVIASRNEKGQAGRHFVKPKGLRWNGETSAIVDNVTLDDGTEVRKVYRAKQGCTQKCDEDFELAMIYKDGKFTHLTKEECKNCRSDKDIVKLAEKKKRSQS